MNAGERVTSHAIRAMEQPFVKRVSEWIKTVDERSRPWLTDFLTPREQIVLGRMVSGAQLHVQFDGGADTAERKRAFILPGEWPMDPELFGIRLLCADVPKGTSLSHGSALGSLLGTGIHRRKLGDIAVFDDAVLAFVCEDIVTHLIRDWTAIGRQGVAVHTTSLDREWPEPLYVRDIIEVTSARADSVVAHATHQSRSKVSELFAKGHVSLNFVELSGPDVPVEEGDILSVRGFGRVRVFEFLGETRSGRTRVEVGTLASKRQ